MKCPKPCWTELEPSATGTVCPACGRTGPILTDYCGYIPSAGYRPSAYRPDDPGMPSPFRELAEEEKGWPQTDAIAFAVDLEETPRERAQRERRESETPEQRAAMIATRTMTRLHAYALREDTRRVNAATAKRGEYSRRSRASRAA